jgi:hypothetical protein
MIRTLACDADESNPIRLLVPKCDAAFSLSTIFPPLRTGLLLLLLPQGQQTDTGHLDDLESDTGNITLGLALATETSQEDLVVLVHEVKATVVGDESRNLLAVLDQLDTDTLSDGGVGLLGLDTDLLEDDALGVGRATEGRGLESGAQGTLLIVKVGPFLVLSVRSQLAGSVKTTGFASSHFCFSKC